MALRFAQQILPPGVFHILMDDGTDVTHIFAECARWEDVRRAAEQGSTVYASACWQPTPLKQLPDVPNLGPALDR